MAIYLALDDRGLTRRVRRKLSADRDLIIGGVSNFSSLAETAGPGDCVIVAHRILQRAFRTSPEDLARTACRATIIVVASETELTLGDAALQFAHGWILPQNFDRIPEIIRLAKAGHCLFPQKRRPQPVLEPENVEEIGRLSAIECLLLSRLVREDDEDGEDLDDALSPKVARSLLRAAYAKLRLRNSAEARDFAHRYCKELRQWRIVQNRNAGLSNGRGRALKSRRFDA